MMFSHNSIAVALLVMLSFVSSTNARLGATASSHRSHRKLQQAPEGTAVAGEFFVVFDQATVSEEEMNQKILDITDGLYDGQGKKLELTLLHKFKTSFRGFYVSDTTTELLQALLDSDDVESVEEVSNGVNAC